MKITNIVIRKYFFDDTPLKAVSSVTFDDCFVVHDVKIISASDKTFVVMPGRNIRGQFRDVAHPTNSDFRHYFENAVLDEYVKGLDAARAEAEKLEAEVEQG